MKRLAAVCMKEMEEEEEKTFSSFSTTRTFFLKFFSPKTFAAFFCWMNGRRIKKRGTLAAEIFYLKKAEEPNIIICLKFWRKKVHKRLAKVHTVFTAEVEQETLLVQSCCTKSRFFLLLIKKQGEKRHFWERGLPSLPPPKKN